MGAPKQFASKPGLAHSYFQMSLAVYGTKAEGLRRLNAALKTSYSFGHISRWERGDREPDRAARLAMMKDVLPWQLGESGLLKAGLDRDTQRMLDAVAERLA
jgi:transcriptional regulator with XRE-family HTH domain